MISPPFFHLSGFSIQSETPRSSQFAFKTFIEFILQFKHHSFYVYLSTAEFSSFKYLILNPGPDSPHECINISKESSIWYVIAIVVIRPPRLIPHRVLLANPAQRKSPTQRKNVAPQKGLRLAAVRFLGDERRLD